MVVGGKVMGILGEKNAQLHLLGCPPLSSSPPPPLPPPPLGIVTIPVSDQSQTNKGAVTMCHGAGRPGSPVYSLTWNRY